MSVDLSVFDPLTSVLAPCFCKCPLMALKQDIDADAEHVRFQG